MNLKKISLLTAASVLALASCKNAHNDVEQPASGEQTSGMLRIKVATPNGTRAANTSEGRQEEQKVSKVNIYIFAPNGNLVDNAEFSEDTNGSGAWTEATTDKFAKESDGILVVPFQTKAQAGVDNKLVVILNQPSTFTAPSNYDGFTNAATTAIALTYTDHVSNMAKDNNFMMVGCVPKFVLKADKEFNDVKGDFSATDANKNQYLVNADRAVSKLVVNIKNGVSLVGKVFGSGDAAATIQGYSLDGAVSEEGANLYFTVANSNKAMYVYNNPRTTQEGPDASNGVVAVADANYKTPNMDKKATSNILSDAETFYKDFFYHISEDAQNIVSGTGFYAPIEVKNLAAAAATDADYYVGKYFMEADNKTEWLWANTPVAKIYACILPKNIYVLNEDKVSVKKIAIADLKALKATATEDKSTAAITADGSFFMGLDGKFYASQGAANVNNGKAWDAADGTDAVKTQRYDKGRCVYRFPVNADNYDYTSFTTAYNKRNHIYHLTIQDITGIGDNYDPTDPKDPNVPMPTNGEDPDNPGPNEPTPDPNKPIKKTKTYAAVKCVIKPWTVVSNNITLGN